VNQVLTKQLVNAGFSQDEANRIVKSNAVQWPGLQ